MKPSPFRILVTISIIIVSAWLFVLLLRFAAWLLSGLVGVAAIILVIALIYRLVRSPRASTPTSTKKPPLRVEREPSKEDR